jgi:serine/threonine protein kinase
MAEHALFICYSHTDQKYREQFSKFLVTVKEKQRVDVFSDAEISVGDNWQKTIIDNLKKATAALVLVSQDVMVSPFIQQVELREILEARVKDGLRLFLVAVRAVAYKGTYLDQFQWARAPDKPLSLLPEAEQEVAMVDICMKIASELGTKADEATIQHTLACLKSIPKLDLPSVYELEEPVGEGEFARCFKAHDRLLDRKVIIKILNTELSRDSPAYDKYVRSASKLNHRNILSLLFSQANTLPHFIVTPAVGDLTLEHRLAGEQGGPPSFEQAVEYTIQLAEVLAYAHRQGCVHGRLRPCEVRIDREGELILSSFRTLAGCAAVKKPVAEERMSLEDFVYSSPERRECGVVDAKTDQYQLGLLAYEMIAKTPPVRASTWAALLDQRNVSALLHPRPLKEFVAECDEQISDVVMRMLSVDPQDRWDSLDTVKKKLEEARSGTSYIDEAKKSYRRCAQDIAFYQTVYDNLFQTIDGIEGMFIHRTREEQYQVLRDALWLLLTYPETREQNEPTILSGIARTHARYNPQQFDAFGEAVLKAVAKHDPLGSAALGAWRGAITPGLDYLKSKAGKAAAV